MVVLDVVQIVFWCHVVVPPQRLREARRLGDDVRVREDEVLDDIRAVCVWEIYFS